MLDLVSPPPGWSRRPAPAARRLPPAAAAAVALAGSTVAAVTSRVMWLGGGSEAVTEHMELGAGIRNLLLALAWLLLMVAAFRRPRSGGRVRR